MSEEWDNLIILDGCRFDLFEEVNPFEYDVESVISQGSATPEFLHNNFRNEQYLDTVYISANPMVAENDLLDSFHKVYKLWETDWDDELNVVPPEAVEKKVITAHEQYPNKRLLIHFQQPHSPWIGETGQEFERMWPLLRDGEITEETMWEVQKENLKLALPYVEKIIQQIDGRTVVTADHGQAMGEWKQYGHPENRCIQALIKVPWVVIPTGKRRKIIEASAPEQLKETDDEVIDDRLEALGYKI